MTREPACDLNVASLSPETADETDSKIMGADEDAIDLPVTFLDTNGRTIEIREYDDEFDVLFEMYVNVPTFDRAQGIPPATEPRIRSWLNGLLADGIHLIAWHDETVVGHVALVPIDENSVELLVFVAHDYQAATIGTHLLYAVFECAQDRGISRIWLTVEGSNRIARNLYTSTGFHTVRSGREYEMERKL